MSSGDKTPIMQHSLVYTSAKASAECSFSVNRLEGETGLACNVHEKTIKPL